MTRKKYADHPVRDRFAAKLQTLVTDSGLKFPQIVERAVELPGLYPELFPGGTPPKMSVSCISEILRGRRDGLPDPLWVRNFVLCWQAAAHAARVTATDPGLAGVQPWLDDLRRAEDEARALGLYVHATGPRAAEHRPSEPPPATCFRLAEPCEGAAGTLTRRQADVLRGYADYGRSLLTRLDEEDPDAQWQAAVLLGAEPAHAERALHLLTLASRHRHLRALDLLQSAPRVLDRGLARAEAVQLAVWAGAGGHTQAAAAFRTCAERYDAVDRAADPRSTLSTAFDPVRPRS